jgi:hypothetical protein
MKPRTGPGIGDHIGVKRGWVKTGSIGLDRSAIDTTKHVGGGDKISAGGKG